MRTAVFPGSFNPFTKGHKSIVDRALRMFDHIIIAIGQNIDKPDDVEKARLRKEEIASLFKDCGNVSVETYDGLTVDFCKKCGATAILRGIRNSIDFEYEKNIADVNMRIAGIDTVFLVTEPQYGCISSTIVRDLSRHGYDVSEFLP